MKSENNLFYHLIFGIQRKSCSASIKDYSHDSHSKCVVASYLLYCINLSLKNDIAIRVVLAPLYSCSLMPLILKVQLAMINSDCYLIVVPVGPEHIVDFEIIRVAKMIYLAL